MDRGAEHQMGYGVHLFIYGTKQAVFWIGTTKHTTSWLKCT